MERWTAQEVCANEAHHATPVLFSRTLTHVLSFMHVLKPYCMNWSRAKHALRHSSEQSKQVYV